MGANQLFEDFYSFANTPFTRNIPVESLFNSNIVEEVTSRLEFVADRQQFALVVGDCGTGKTTIIRKFQASLNPDKYRVLYVSDSQMTPRNFYTILLEQFGVTAHYYRSDAKRQLHKEIELLKSAHKIKPIVVTDESHLFRREMLEEIRFTLNYKYDSVSPMALILVGQSELLDTLKRQPYQAIRQRVDMKCVIPGYDHSQVSQYIACHMAYAGSASDIFSDSAVDSIFKFSGGSARMINKVCTACLNFGAQNKKKIIDDHMVKDIIEQEMI
jgi:type II secretory pathway predicted ATPase ExeA